jgi:chemotaxis protein methyltransferase CheR
VGGSFLPLSPQVFAILSGLVAEHAGLQFDVSHLEAFADKAGARAADRGFESLLDYYYFLRYDPGGRAELDALVETLVVGETYFFRELDPLETMVSDVVEPLVVRGLRPRIWCAASATGEEPHTVAMLLAQRGILDEVQIVASDINRAALDKARSGRFSRRALRQQLPAFANHWIEVAEHGLTVRPRLTAAIDWQRINLLDDAAVSSLGNFDVILCRNVLIYFSDTTTRQVAERLERALRPGGALIVGVSESLLRFSVPLACEERNGVFFYRKRS